MTTPLQLPFKDSNNATLHVGDVVKFNGAVRTIRFGEYTNGEDDFFGAYIERRPGVGTGRKTAFNAATKV